MRIEFERYDPIARFFGAGCVDMQTRVRRHFHDQRKTIPRSHRRVARIGGHVQMVRGNFRGRHGSARLAPQFDEKAGYGIAVDVEIFKESRRDAPLAIDNQRAWECHPGHVRPRANPGDVFLDVRLHCGVVAVWPKGLFHQCIEESIPLDRRRSSVR